MFLDRLLKRRPRVAPKYESQEGLAALARGDADRGVRMDAVRRLTSLSSLRQVLADEQDSGLREIAFGRYRSLLSRADADAPPIESCIQEVRDSEDHRLIEHLAQSAGDADIRLAAIHRVETPGVLVSCCLHDQRSANRSAAQERIQDRASLEQVARQIGKKDKGVYRRVRERLRRMAEADEKPRRVRAQCEELCERLGQLGHLEQWSQDRALLDHIDQQWSEIVDQAELSQREHYDELRTRFLSAYAVWREANVAQAAEQEEQQALRVRAETVIAALEQATHLGHEDAMRAERQRLLDEWDAIGAASSALGVPSRRFGQVLAQLDAVLDRREQHQIRRERMQRVIAEAEGLVEQSQPIEHTAAKDLIKSGRRLAEGSVADLAGRFEALVERMEARIETQRKRATQRLEDLPPRLDELEQALESGELKRAEPLYQSLLAATDLAQASGVGGRVLRDAQDRLRQLASRVRDLKHWRRWGADRHREALCDAMEALRMDGMPLAAVAERLHVLQMDWKELDRSGAPANRRLWDRFHAAGDAVRERCRPLWEAEASEREANREAREAVCEQIESFLGSVDWERVDWRRVMQAERETRRAWAAIGQCEAKARRALERRFHKAIKALDRRLDDERERNQALKRDLIERAKALAESPDLNAAIEEVKALQRQWHTTVPARQRDEHRLWSELRVACDSLFERRVAIHHAHRAELQENLAAKDALCVEAESACSIDVSADALVRTERDLAKRWDDLDALPLPREAASGITRRWRAARRALDSRVEALRAKQLDVELDRLAQRAALCESLEKRLMAGEVSDTAQNGAGPVDEWSALPPLEDPTLQAAMQRRFDAAVAAFDDAAARGVLLASVEANAERRARLCLELEIAAGVDSPPAVAQERLRLQVARLADRLGEGERDPVGDAASLVQDWYLCGPAPADSVLDERIAHVRAAFRPQKSVSPEAA